MRSLFVPLLLGALLLAPALAAAPGPATSSGASIQVPSFRVGESATYEWTSGGTLLRFDRWVDRLDRTLDASAREVDVAVFAIRDADVFLEQRISLASMLEENAWLDCAIRRAGGQCMPWDLLSWSRQGIPGVWGATLVHGRNVTVGDAWTVQGECRPCVAPVSVRVDPPAANSPPGTTLVLNLSSPYHANRTDRLHLGPDHAFPLLAEVHDLRGILTQIRLVGHAPGAGAPVAAPATPAAPSYPSALPAPVPFQQGRPVEGVPIRDYPSVAEARAAGGPDPLDLDPALTLVSLSQHVTPRGARVWTDVVPTERTVLVEALFAKDGQDDVGVRYQRDDVYPLGQAVLGPGPWQTFNVTGSSRWHVDPSIGCAAQSPPLWDVVRHGESLGFLNDVRGFWWFRTWSEAGCEGWQLDVVGPVHAFEGETPVGVGRVGTGPGHAESIRYDLQTGLLVAALVWPSLTEALE